MSAAVDFGTASTVLAGLSKYGGNPEVSAGLSLASMATGVIGSLMGAKASEKAAKKAAKATAKYRKHVMKKLTDINNTLTAVDSELGTIDSELKNVYKEIETSNDVEIGKLFGIIDGFYQDFAAYEGSTTDSSSEVQKLADKALDPTTGIVYAMNAIHEAISNNVFSPGAPLEGQVSIAGYAYLQTKLLMGLHLLGYACFYASDSPDFGTFFYIWSQNFADQIKAIIAYGKANPGKVDPYTAHFSVYFSAWDFPASKDSTPLYCSDAICFSPQFTPTSPYEMVLAKVGYENDNYHSLVWDGSQYPFITRVGELVPDPVPGQKAKKIPKDQKYFGCFGWDSGAKPLQAQVPYVVNEQGQTAMASLYISSANPAKGFKEALVTQLNQSGTAPLLNQIFLAPKKMVVQNDTVYLGSVDGMLNLLYQDQGSMTAFLYEGTSKGKLFRMKQGASESDTVTLSDINTLTDCAVEISIESIGKGSPSQIYVKFCAANTYVTLQGSNWVPSKSPAAIGIAPNVNSQPIQDPYSMKPVSFQFYDASNPGDGAINAIVHQSPFD